MAELSLPARDSVAAQAEMFRRAEREEGLSIRDIAKRSPLKISTMEGWASGSQMPAWAIGALKRAGVPVHLLSLVLDPFDAHVGANEEGDSDLDDAADAAGELASAVRRARHPNSPGGVAIVHSEVATIRPIARRVIAKARKVAA